jgi:SAM-dependent methyltransferase
MNVLGFSVTRRVPPQGGVYDGYPSASILGKHFINVGAGNFSHRYWTNVDHASGHYASTQSNPFVEHDLMSLKPLPLESGAAEVVYVSHVAEHISDEAAKVLFREAYRVLKPGGIFRMTSPNILLYYDALRRGDRLFWYMAESYYAGGYTDAKPKYMGLQQLFLFEFATMLSSLSKAVCRKADNYDILRAFKQGPTDEAFTYFTSKCNYLEEFSGYHINYWTVDKCLRMLGEAGFSEVYPSAYGQSRSPPMRDTALFDNTHPKLSLYVEAVK